MNAADHQGNAFVTFKQRPSPLAAIELAIADHKAWWQHFGPALFDLEFVDMLNEAANIIRANTARNTKTGGKA